MAPDIVKGIAYGLGMILIIVAIGMGIGFACSGGEYEVDPPEEAERVGELDETPDEFVVRG